MNVLHFGNKQFSDLNLTCFASQGESTHTPSPALSIPFILLSLDTLMGTGTGGS